VPKIKNDAVRPDRSEVSCYVWDRKQPPHDQLGAGRWSAHCLAGPNGNLHQLWYAENTGQWAAQSQMTVPNAVAVGPGMPMTSWVQADDGPHVVYADANGHLNQIWHTIPKGVCSNCVLHLDPLCPRRRHYDLISHQSLSAISCR